MRRIPAVLFLIAAALVAAGCRQTPKLYVVGYAHLDTEWNWEYPQSISQYVLNTMRTNFAYFPKYPHYVFNFSGSNRYRFMKEYFPSDYAKVKQYVAQGRWFPAGSSVEEGDVNAPSAEGIFRQVLYGNEWFRKELGKASEEYMLPDCFGFPASLPTILAHAGVKGFSTQKLTWGSSARAGGPNSPEKTPEGTPFNVGVWVGPDGESVVAALNPLTYSGDVSTDLSSHPGPPPQPNPAWPEQAQRRFHAMMQNRVDWVNRLNLDGEATGVYKDYHYYGTGDIGGGPRENSVKLMEAIVTKSTTVLPPPHMRGRKNGEIQPPPPGPPVTVGKGPVQVISATADQMFRDLTPKETGKLPRYTGEMELTNHSAGSLTSEAYIKRWIRKNELLADAAEKASVAAAWMGGRAYPMERLNDAWTLELGAHFHDLAAGTGTPGAYRYAWNDLVIAMNQFAGVLQSATEAIASGMDTQAQGTPVVVYNPLNIAREDVVEAALPRGGSAVRVIGPDGQAVPSQVENGKVLFVAKAPSVGYAVYDVQPGKPAEAATGLKASATELENARYRVKVDANGDVASIFDKSLNKELLSAPIRLAISTDKPQQWPAWNMDFDQEQAAPRAYVGGKAKIAIVEHGPVRVAIQVTRGTEDSKFVQTVSLSAGDAGNRVEFGDSIDWHTKEANLKAAFPLTAKNRMATYNWDVGTIERPTAEAKKFEVPSHQWIDLTDASGGYGVTILTDCKNASDKPNDDTIRLTLVRSPGVRNSYTYQAAQDWGHHEIAFGLAAHNGDWRQGGAVWQAFRLDQPLIAFATAKHAGALGKEFSILRVNNPSIRVLALKKAEASDEIVVRMVEMDGKAANGVHVSFPAAVTAAREMNAQEQPLGNATVATGDLVTNFAPYQPRTFAVQLAAATTKLAPVVSQPVELTYDLAAASNDDAKTTPGFDGKGDALPAEMLPGEVAFGGVKFKLAAARTGAANALVAHGQNIALPAGEFNRVYVLAAAEGGDQQATLRAGNTTANVSIENWGGSVGQWDQSQWKEEPQPDWSISANPAEIPTVREHQPHYPEDFVGVKPGFIKRADIGWYCSHHHTAEGKNDPYAYSYLFVYSLEVPKGAKTLTLPNNNHVRVMAVSVANEEPAVQPAEPLYDTLR